MSPGTTGDIEHQGWRIAWTESAGTATRNGERVVLYETPPPSPDCPSSVTGQVLSVVAQYVSVSVAEEGDCEGAAHPFAQSEFRVFDLSAQGRRVTLSELVPEDQLLRALVADRVIQQSLHGGSAASLDELFRNADGGCEMSIDSTMLRSFAFHHVRGDDVAVRIGVSHGCEVERGRLTQLGLYLRFSPELTASARESAREGLLMDRLLR